MTDHASLLRLRYRFQDLIGGNEPPTARPALNAGLHALTGKRTTGAVTIPDYLGSMGEMAALAATLLGAVKIVDRKPNRLLLSNKHAIQLTADGVTHQRSHESETIALGSLIVEALLARNERAAETGGLKVDANNQTVPADLGADERSTKGEAGTTGSRAGRTAGSSRPTGMKIGATPRQAGSTSGSFVPPGRKAPQTPRHV